MKEIIKSIYNLVDNKFYFKLLFLFVSLTYVTILKYIPGVLLLKNVALAWGLMLILFMMVDGYKRRKIYKFDIPLAVFMVITLIFNFVSYRSSENIITWIVNLLLFTIVSSIDVFRNKKTLVKELNIITYFYACFMMVFSIISLAMRFSGKTIEMGQVVFGNTKGLFENENALSIATALAIVMCIYLINIAKNHKFKIFWTANTVLQVITMIGSHGRSALLIVIAVVYVFIFVLNRSKYIRVVLLLIPILACGAFIQIDKDNIRNFTSGRSSIWTSASIVIENQPLTGVGRSNLVDSVKKARETNNLPDDLPGLETGRLHNIYVETAATNGVISLMLFLTFILMILIFFIQHLDKLARKEKMQMTTLISLLVGILAVNLFESSLIYVISFISMIFWIYIGYLVSILDNKNIE